MKSYITGYRPAVYARVDNMLGIRQPLDGLVFANLEHAFWGWQGIEGLFDPELDIYRFESMVSYADPPLTF